MVIALLMVLLVANLVMMYMITRMMRQLIEHSKRLSGLVQARQSSITTQSYAGQLGVRPDIEPLQPHGQSSRPRSSAGTGRQSAGIKMKKVGGDDG